MINPQLSEYITSQLKAGVPKDAVKAALLASGWAEGDVNEALAAADLPVAAPAVIAASSPVAVAKPAMIKTSDIFQPKNEPVFQPRSAGGDSAVRPALAQNVSPTITPVDLRPSGWRRYLLPGIFGIVALLGVGLGVYFGMQAGNLEIDLDAARSNRDVLAAQLAGAQKERDDLQLRVAQIDTLQTNITALQAELAIVKTPENATTSADLAIKGTLRGGDGKNAYVIRTANDIVVSIKNGKDAKVEAVLKPLLGTAIEVSGGHTLGAKEITVVTVNGKAIE